jgi:predicted ATP-binding protein involved in virulence
MTQYYLSKLAVTKLWGQRKLEVNFQPDINIIIGPNASGKTTVITH